MKGHQSARASAEDWLTPPEILQSLGRFDLDPCAAQEPRPWSTAAYHYALPKCGLSLPWFGAVWCNPPFGAKADAWLAKAADHGNAVVLIPAATETARWFRYVWGVADAVLFMRSRPHFHRPDGSRASANSGCSIALVAYGAGNVGRLSSCGLGRVVMP